MRAPRWSSRRTALLVLLGLAGAGVVFRFRWSFWSMFARLRGRKTVADRLEALGPAARARIREQFRRMGVSYPPQQLVLLGLKAERELKVVARRGSRSQLVLTYPVLAASGTSGPKLREGDRQVPEGVYSVESLNPNSIFHLSLRLNYPNEFDVARAQAEGRADLGSDIMIHGGQSSIGCLAIGDAAIEDLFVLVADVGIDSVQVVLSPHDFRAAPAPHVPEGSWDAKLYSGIEREFERLRD